MSTPQPIDDKDRASLDGLEGVFTDEEKTSKSSDVEKEEDKALEEEEQDENQETDEVDQSDDEDDDDDDEEESEDQSEEEETELEEQADEENKVDSEIENNESSEDSMHNAGTSLAKSFVDGEDRVARQDLINLLEGFVGILKKDGGMSFASELGKTQQPEELKFTDVDVEDRTVELEDMRRLMIEAQETIIKLLTDRVEDRARIATLETELRLLPDLQEQADRAMAVAFKTEEFRTELHKVKYELEKSRIASVRKDMYKGPKGLLTKVQRWLIKAKGRSQLQFNENHAQDRLRQNSGEAKG